jgi:hypothetical protein
MLSPTFPEIHLPHLADTPIPPMLRVRLTHPKGGPIADIAGAALPICTAARAWPWPWVAAASRTFPKWWRQRCAT